MFDISSDILYLGMQVNPKKVMWLIFVGFVITGGICEAQNDGSLVPITGMMNSEKYIELLKRSLGSLSCVKESKTMGAFRFLGTTFAERLSVRTDQGNSYARDPLKVRSYYDSGTDCAAGTECSPMHECPSMIYEIAKMCYYGDKTLFCGGGEDMPYVCCPSSPLEKNQVCGKALVQGQFYKGLGTYPFIARVGFKHVNTGSFAYPCAGSIIARRVILTAAHCALAKADGHRLSSVRVGEYDTSTDPDCASTGFCAPRAVNHAISHVIVHPDYKQGQYHHDIALLVLKTPLNYSVATQPICLLKSRANLVVGKRAIIAGWGKISTSSKRSPEMVQLDVPLTSWDMCLRNYGATGALESPNSIEGQWMCAGGEGKDVCQGFGGAPLFIQDSGIYSQIGIMSFGSDNCGGLRIPSVYTSVSHFADWIHDNTPLD